MIAGLQMCCIKTIWKIHGYDSGKSDQTVGIVGRAEGGDIELSWKEAGKFKCNMINNKDL